MASWGRQIKHHRILILREIRLERDTTVGVQIQGKNKVYQIIFFFRAGQLFSCPLKL